MSRLEDELDELGGELSETLDELSVPASLLDRDGVIKWQNRASREINGYVVGSRFTSVVASHDRPDAQEMLTRILCRGEPADLTIELRTAAGGYLSREISAAPVRDGGSVVGLFGIGRLTTRRAPGRRAPAPESSVRLTGQQRRVLRLLAEGKSTAEIASELTLSQATVRNHVAAVIAALGVHTRLQAVIAAQKAALLDP